MTADRLVKIFPTNFSSQCISYESYHQFVKVLLVKVSGMLHLSNFVIPFHRQSFALYGNKNNNFKPNLHKNVVIKIFKVYAMKNMSVNDGCFVG